MTARDSPGPDALAHALARQTDWCDAGPVEWIQTHISHVFLAGDRVYKLRKDVRLAFLDFGTRAERNQDCLREVALNRRLAPTVYLGVAPVFFEGDAVRMGPAGENLRDPDTEHAVVMRRLPAGRDAHSLLEQGRLDAGHLEAVAQRLQRFHAEHGLGTPAPWSAAAWLERVAAPLQASLDAMAESGLAPAARIETLGSRSRAWLRALEPRLEVRRLEGRAVDGHGDVHLEHVWFEEGEHEPALIDCLEFDADLRRIDVASEVAFLAMDLRYRGRSDLAEWFLAAYATRADDYGLFGVVDFYALYRAAVRAKVAGLAATQPGIDPDQQRKARGSFERHLALSEALLEPPGSGDLVLMCGTVGTGKSSVARRLGADGRGVPISSDRVRKVLAGIAATDRSGAALDEGIYRPERSDAVYRALLERAAPVVGSGRTAILDASFSKRARRDAARAWADERGVSVRLIEVRCDEETVRARLAERTRRGTDPSDAGEDFLATSLARFEPPDEWPAADREVIRT